jgi:hypothetical protein
MDSSNEFGPNPVLPSIRRVAELNRVYAEVERMSRLDDPSVDDGWVPWGLIGAPGELQQMVDNGSLEYRETELSPEATAAGVLKKWVRPTFEMYPERKA